MLFDSYIFIFAFLPMTLLGFFLLTKYQKCYLALSWLVFASLIFYAWWNPVYILLLLLSITVNYFLGTTLCKKSAKVEPTSKLLFFGVTLNLLFIGYFKYAFFFISNLNPFLTEPIDFGPLILPLGISFFTFQKIAFLVDASRGEIKQLKLRDYCLFVTFFPQLIAGPIVQHKQIIPQFSNPEKLRVKSEYLSIGLTIFFIGLFKKLGLADSISIFANAAFNGAANGIPLTFWEAWGGACAYALQLYFDFSGYSDMAVGLAYLFGIELPINFFSPYKAVNIIDFWHRWHITLSSFLKDYLYIPLGGNRKGPLRRYINLLLTMLLGGLWHGANWTFVLWGTLHGIYLAINHFWQWSCQALGLSFVKRTWFKYFSHLLTLMAVVVAWVPFRAENFQVAKLMLTSMFSLTAISLPQSLTLHFYFLKDLFSTFGWQAQGMFYNGLANWYVGMLWIFGLGAIALFMPNTVQFMHRYFPSKTVNTSSRAGFLHWQPSAWWAAALALLVLIAVMLLSEESEFLYFQF